MCEVFNLKKEQKKRQIEEQYQALIKAFDEQYDVTIRLLRAEQSMRNTIAKADRDQKLKELDNN